MNMIWLAAVAAALFFGFCAGRMTGGGNNETEEADPQGQTDSEKDRNRRSDTRPGAGSVGSPVSGKVEDMQEGARPVVVIRPSEDRLYAPMSGKIIKLFPLGNAFLFRTEFGAELYIQAGEGNDELLGRYYRPRIVQNEIVGKGKLLLEFDRLALEAEGTSPRVSVAVETGVYGSEIKATAGEHVRTGEEILRICQPG